MPSGKKDLATLTYRQPLVAFVILFVLVALGLNSLLTIGRQEDPTITNLFATVTTPFPGADPARVEALVTIPIEEAVQEIAEVDTIESTSATGVSIVSLELLDRLDDEAIEGIWGEVRDALEEARRTFPPGALPTQFDSDGVGAFAAIVSLNGRHGDVPLTLVDRYARGLADLLRGVSGTKIVERYGAPEEEVLVSVDATEAAALGLNANDFSSTIAAADAKVRAGLVRGRTSDLVIEVTGEIDALSRVRDIVVATDGASSTRIGDIATVTRGARYPASEIAYQDSERAILVAVKIEEGLQVDAWMKRARTAIDAFEVPAGIEKKLVFDQSAYTRERLLEVATNMAIGVSLVVGVLLLTLGLRSALIVALALPVVLLASLATMQFIGLAIHQMSVTGLIVALGLLVDAAIVMVDEVGRRIRAGIARSIAVGQSVRRLAAPLLASTLTTMLAFLPMILLPGPAGDFVGSIAMAVVIMLGWSLFVALTITPAIAGRLLKVPNRPIRPSFLGSVFHRSFYWSVSNPVKSIAFALILPITGFLVLPTLTKQFFPGVDRNQFHIDVEMVPGSAIRSTDQTARAIDKVLQNEETVEAVSWVIGRSAPAFYYNIVGDRDNAPDFAQALVTTSSPEDTERLLPRLQAELSAAHPEARVIVQGLKQGPPVPAPVELRIIGPEVSELRRLGEELRDIVSGMDGIVLARSSIDAGAPQLRLDLEEETTRLVGLDLNSVARQLEAGLEGVTGGSLLEGTEQLPVRVRLVTGTDTEALRSDPTAIADLPLTVPGVSIGPSISALGNVELVPSEPGITRRNGERFNTIQGFVPRDLLPEEALQQVLTALEDQGFEVPPGYQIQIGGDSDARDETILNLASVAILVATLTTAVLVLTFNSIRLTLVSLVVCALSAGLSILSLSILQHPFGIQAVIGVIGSIGVSINAAIIVLTGLRDEPAAAGGNKFAMARVVSSSGRHIVSTTVTTFGGFLPLLLAGGGFWPPFATAIAGGVLLSVVIAFYFTPPAFALVYAGSRRRPEVGTAHSQPRDDRQDTGMAVGLA
ncbi:MAG: efflux RND transporter permease subunit [Pseudomonadota bacterium]